VLNGKTAGKRIKRVGSDVSGRTGHGGKKKKKKKKKKKNKKLSFTEKEGGRGNAGSFTNEHTCKAQKEYRVIKSGSQRWRVVETKGSGEETGRKGNLSI